MQRNLIIIHINCVDQHPPNFNPKDQGHVAFTINSSKKGLLDTKIIHSINDKDKKTGKVYKNVTIQKVKEYHNYKRHTHICLPQNWLLKN